MIIDEYLDRLGLVKYEIINTSISKDSFIAQLSKIVGNEQEVKMLGTPNNIYFGSVSDEGFCISENMPGISFRDSLKMGSKNNWGSSKLIGTYIEHDSGVCIEIETKLDNAQRISNLIFAFIGIIVIIVGLCHVFFSNVKDGIMMTAFGIIWTCINYYIQNDNAVSVIKNFKERIASFE